MPTVVGVRLRFSKTLWFDPAGATPAEGDVVVVETERGTELGTVVQPPHDVERSALPAALKPMARVADQSDLAVAAQNHEREAEALKVFREMVEERRLDMKPVDVEYSFGGDKIVFYFSAEERIDFRDLVKELANRFHARIDMRQVGVRDEARAVGGVGHCGQMLCCVRFGGDFQPVSIRMAKEQDLPLNPLKISGLCGRLMCCLRYEYDAYKDFKGRAPKKGAIIETPVGLAKVDELNTLREKVRIRMEDGTSVTIALSEMECAKGSGCPCSVTRESLEEASAGTLPALVAEAAAAAKPPAAEPVAAKDEPARESSGRKRRRRKSSGGGGSEQASGSQGEQPKQAAKRAPREQAKPAPSQPTGEGGGQSDAQGGAEGGDKPTRSSRRRRRRRPSGGGGGGGAEGAS
ncbi:MAG: stage 0 sporulation family protein [Coriobacteriia bacterium]|nr:stage 0 sporulation family protein [Coriobacteriia bacterium]